jgi:hypothetical protein
MTARFRIGMLAAISLLVAAGISAQQPPRAIAPGNTVLIATYTCAPDQFARADAAIKESVAPILDKHVASGKLITWGYLATTLGGPANRHIYIWARDPVTLLQARQVYLAEILATPQYAEYSKLCGSATVSLSNLVAMAK